MLLTDINLAAYLDEAGEDPQASCKSLAEHNIHYTILREAWTGNVCDMSDNGHGKLRSLLSSHDISAIMIASILGKVDHNQLPFIDDNKIINCINICKYYQCKYLRIYAGEVSDKNSAINIPLVYSWVKRVTEACEANGIICLYEITSDSTIFQATDAAKLLSSNKNIGLIYDAAGLILKHNFNPFIKHWPLLKSFTHIVDVRDVKIGHGYKVVGYGDTNIAMTITDAINCNYKGWFAIEPTLGRKFGSAITKQQTFAYAVEGLGKILQKL